MKVVHGLPWRVLIDMERTAPGWRRQGEQGAYWWRASKLTTGYGLARAGGLQSSGSDYL
ncbi:hypothetical protein KCP75_01720 [Salmonella enterica subsp. enterica]|nr:hypothetical protein KCP75_01720 [Salmonella enterica subsp. enterica]